MNISLANPRAIFFGAGEFALPALRTVAKAREVALVVAPPPRPAGRKMRMQSCPVATEAARMNLPLLEAKTPAAALSPIRESGARVFVVCDYGALLPRTVLRAPRDGALNIHASLLPRWRGASPIRSAILAGDETTGVTIMKMDTGLDTGAILLRRETAVGTDETFGALSQRLSEMGAEMIGEALDKVRELEERPQLGEATWAKKLSADARNLNFRNDAETEARRTRAFAPSPGARTTLRSVGVKVLSAKVAHDGDGTDGADGADGVGGVDGVGGSGAEPGTVLRADETGLTVACGRGALSLLRLQRDGGRQLSAGEFLRGFPAAVGERVGVSL